MNKNRFAKRTAAAAGFFFLCAAPRLTRAQNSPPSPASTPSKTSPAVRPKKNTSPPDYFAGLQYTDEQKAQIDQIHQDMKSRMDAAVKDPKLSAQQRDAMLAGYQRMERSQVYNKVLTTAQRKEVRRRIRARQAAEQAEQNKQSSPK